MNRAPIQPLCTDPWPHRPRDAVRSKVFRLAGLLTARGAERAHVLDVSETGARLHCAAALVAGDDVAIEAAGVMVRGCVMWVAEGRIGLRFHRRLKEAELAQFLAPIEIAR